MTMHDLWMKIWSNFIGWILFPLILAAAAYAFQKINKILETKRRHFKFVKMTVRDQQIKEALIELRALLHADRAYVVMFHNGSVYQDGSHDLKKSRTHEVVGPGVSYESQNYQDIRISLVLDEIELLKAEQQPTYHKRSDFKDSSFRRMLESQGVAAISRCPLKRGKDTIGFIGVDCPDDDGPPPNIEIMCQYAGRIETIMSRYRDE